MGTTRRRTLVLLCSAAVVIPSAAAASAAQPRHSPAPAGAETVLISQGLRGRLANADSGTAKISENGNRVAFGSFASNLVRHDTNEITDLFLRTVSTGRTRLVTIGWDGEPVDGVSRVNDINPTGRFVAYDSIASNLAGHDTNTFYDVYVRDMTRQRSERISVPAGGGQGNHHSTRPAISDNGRFVAFDSYANNMIADDTNGGTDVFLRDRLQNTTTRVSVGPGGEQANGESANAVMSRTGRIICFDSGADNLASDDTNEGSDVYCYDRNTGVAELISQNTEGVAAEIGSVLGGVSGDGRFVVFTTRSPDIVPGDTNDVADIFVRDRVTDTTERVSVRSNGAQANGMTLWPSISDDGTVVAYDSEASNLVPHDTNGKFDVFVHFLDTGQTRRASVSSAGVQGELASMVSNLSGDGRYVVFQTGATTLFPDDTNDHADVVVRGPYANPPPSSP